MDGQERGSWPPANCECVSLKVVLCPLWNEWVSHAKNNPTEAQRCAQMQSMWTFIESQKGKDTVSPRCLEAFLLFLCDSTPASKRTNVVATLHRICEKIPLKSPDVMTEKAWEKANKELECPERVMFVRFALAVWIALYGGVAKFSDVDLTASVIDNAKKNIMHLLDRFQQSLEKQSGASEEEEKRLFENSFYVNYVTNSEAQRQLLQKTLKPMRMGERKALVHFLAPAPPPQAVPTVTSADKAAFEKLLQYVRDSKLRMSGTGISMELFTSYCDTLLADGNPLEFSAVQKAVGGGVPFADLKPELRRALVNVCINTDTMEAGMYGLHIMLDTTDKPWLGFLVCHLVGESYDELMAALNGFIHTRSEKVVGIITEVVKRATALAETDPLLYRLLTPSSQERKKKENPRRSLSLHI